jgi:hypothetical protein
MSMMRNVHGVVGYYAIYAAQLHLPPATTMSILPSPTDCLHHTFARGITAQSLCSILPQGVRQTWTA